MSEWSYADILTQALFTYFIKFPLFRVLDIYRDWNSNLECKIECECRTDNRTHTNTWICRYWKTNAWAGRWNKAGLFEDGRRFVPTAARLTKPLGTKFSQANFRHVIFLTLMQLRIVNAWCRFGGAFSDSWFFVKYKIEFIIRFFEQYKIRFWPHLQLGNSKIFTLSRWSAIISYR